MEEVNKPRRSPGSYLFSVPAVGAGSNKASAISTALHDHRGPPDDCLVGVGRTPWRTISSTEFSEMLNSRASSMRLTYGGGCSRIGAIMAVSDARKSTLNCHIRPKDKLSVLGCTGCQRPYFTAAAKVMMNAVATANSTAKTESSRRLRCQFAMGDPPQAARSDAPTIRGDPEIVS